MASMKNIVTELSKNAPQKISERKEKIMKESKR